MIRGMVTPLLNALVRFRVRGAAGVESEVTALVDTGFTESLTLSALLVASLGLVRHSIGSAELADGSTSHLDIYSAEVEWGGVWRPILVYALGNETLMGMRLIAGHRLTIDGTAGGLVEITPLS